MCLCCCPKTWITINLKTAWKVGNTLISVPFPSFLTTKSRDFDYYGSQQIVLAGSAVLYGYFNCHGEFLTLKRLSCYIADAYHHVNTAVYSHTTPIKPLLVRTPKRIRKTLSFLGDQYKYVGATYRRKNKFLQTKTRWSKRNRLSRFTSNKVIDC